MYTDICIYIYICAALRWTLVVLAMSSVAVCSVAMCSVAMCSHSVNPLLFLFSRPSLAGMLAVISGYSSHLCLLLSC